MNKSNFGAYENIIKKIFIFALNTNFTLINETILIITIQWVIAFSVLYYDHVW